MSNLNSVFDIRRGFPGGSALEGNFRPAAITDIDEGTLVTVTNVAGKPRINLATAAADLTQAAPDPYPDVWIAIDGVDQHDAVTVRKLACLKLRSGAMIKMAHTDADSLVPGTTLQVDNNGAISAYTTNWAVGVVVETNGKSGSAGVITFAAF